MEDTPYRYDYCAEEVDNTIAERRQGTMYLIISILSEVEDTLRRSLGLRCTRLILSLLGGRTSMHSSCEVSSGGLHAPPSNPRHGRTSSRRSNRTVDSGRKKHFLRALCASLLAHAAAMSHSLSHPPPRSSTPRANKEDQIPRREVASSQLSRVTPTTVGSITA
jgi:hypothetical protein